MGTSLVQKDALDVGLLKPPVIDIQIDHARAPPRNSNKSAFQADASFFNTYEKP